MKFPKICDQQQADLLERLNKIKRLDLAMDNYVVDGTPVIKLIPAEQNPDKDAKEGLVYRPNGLDLPKEIVNDFILLPNLDNHMPVIGSVPMDLANTEIGFRDSEKAAAPSRNPSRKTCPSSNRNREHCLMPCRRKAAAFLKAIF